MGLRNRPTRVSQIAEILNPKRAMLSSLLGPKRTKANPENDVCGCVGCCVRPRRAGGYVEGCVCYNGTAIKL